MSKATIREHFFKTKDQLFASLAKRIADTLTEAVAARKEASLVLSGGATPLPLFSLLAEADIPWRQIWVTLADERWLGPDHPDANERQLRQHLLQGRAASAKLISLKSDHPTPEKGAIEIQARLAAVPRPFDVVVLGMGNDGHVASLFPDGDRLKEALTPPNGELCSSMRAPGAPQPRITLTAPALLHCRDLILLCTAQSKLDTFSRANDPGPIEEMPIRAFLRQKKVPLSFYWAP